METTGLSAYIYKSKFGSCALRGISTVVDEVTVIKPGQKVGPFAPSEKSPAVVIKRKYVGEREYVYAEPFEPVPAGEIGYMAGGTYIGCSDGRFAELTGGLSVVPLHDRSETVDENRTYSI